MNFHIYGENAFTFLFFQEILKRNHLREVLLKNLKSFTNGRRLKPTNIPEESPNLWLFPSFGKRHGFGEPDAILEIGGHVFWFEVESEVDLRSGADTAFLLQLYRFHCAALAFAQNPSIRQRSRGKRKLSIKGPTVTDLETKKDAALDLKGHRARPLLRLLRSASNSSYVLLTVQKPRGAKLDGWRKTLARTTRDLFARWGEMLDLPVMDRVPIDKCWYAYWHGDLSRWIGDEPLSPYVRIK